MPVDAQALYEMHLHVNELQRNIATIFKALTAYERAVRQGTIVNGVFIDVEMHKTSLSGTGRG